VLVIPTSLCLRRLFATIFETLGRDQGTCMNDSKATHTIVSQGSILVNPMNGLTTEVVQNSDGTWSFNWTPIFDGRELPKMFEGVFSSQDGADRAREAFRASEQKKLRPAFFIE
jgi:hypothetical protein